MAGSANLSNAGLAREALISGVINAAFSAVAMMLIFGRDDLVPLRGMNGLAGDSLPQSFAVALMASLVPSLLLNRKCGHALAGAKAIMMRSLSTAIGVTALAAAAHWLLLPSGSLSFRTALFGKTLYGGLLGGGVTLFTLARWSGGQRALGRFHDTSSGQ